MNNILTLQQLISIPSVSRTDGEKEIEQTLMQMLESMPYFKANASNFGTEKITIDALNRQMVWAFKDNGAKQTVILYGHHDTVDVSVYGAAQALAHDAEALKVYLRAQGTEEAMGDDWIFGRGSCDMKAGLAIGLSMLELENAAVNILFLSVPDEEAESLGMRFAAKWLQMFAEARALTFSLSILLEPHGRTEPETFPVFTGSVGKMMPYVLVKGDPVHAGEAFSGLSAVGILMEIVKAVEFNTEMSDCMDGQMTPPPAFLGLRDLKPQYDATLPQYAAGYFNWLLLKGSVRDKLKQLKQQCVWSVEDAINQFNYSYNAHLRRRGMPSFKTCHTFEVEILYLEELIERLPQGFDLNSAHASFIKSNPELSAQMHAIEWTRFLVEASEIRGPVVIIGLMTPYYPAVSGKDLLPESLRIVLEKTLSKQGLSLEILPFFMGISDMSFMMRASVDAFGLAENTPQGLQMSIVNPLEDVPGICLGPWGKGLHRREECVLAKDVTETVPALLKAILTTTFE